MKIICILQISGIIMAVEKEEKPLQILYILVLVSAIVLVASIHWFLSSYIGAVSKVLHNQ